MGSDLLKPVSFSAIGLRRRGRSMVRPDQFDPQASARQDHWPRGMVRPTTCLSPEHVSVRRLGRVLPSIQVAVADFRAGFFVDNCILSH